MGNRCKGTLFGEELRPCSCAGRNCRLVSGIFVSFVGAVSGGRVAESCRGAEELFLST